MGRKTATLIGATGMVGNELLNYLLKDDFFDEVKILVRRPYSNGNPKLTVKLVDFADAESFKLALEESWAVFVTVGTTRAKVKNDREAYRKIDVDIPVKAARFAKETGCERFAMISSVGADRQSRNFYLAIKGEAEERVLQQELSSVHIMRPSLLLGNRKEFRMTEKIAGKLMKWFEFLTPKHYRAIEASTVAAAMAEAVKLGKPGNHVYEYAQIQELANGK